VVWIDEYREKFDELRGGEAREQKDFSDLRERRDFSERRDLRGGVCLKKWICSGIWRMSQAFRLNHTKTNVLNKKDTDNYFKKKWAG